MASRRAGFTLIELSIVLVIIGLLAGGILAGRDLIQAAQIRAAIGQIEKYNTAAHTFRLKYGGLPGDLPVASASAFSFVTRSGADGHGDGDGLIEYCLPVFGTIYFGCEIGLYWRDLSEAGLIDGSFRSVLDEDIGIFGGAALDRPVSNYIPESKLGKGTHLIAFSDAGFNYFQIGGVTAYGSGTTYTFVYTITPMEANAIDGKIDDGKPLTGTVQAKQGAGQAGGDPLNMTAIPAAAGCVATDPGNPYNTLPPYGETPLCHLRVRMQ